MCEYKNEFINYQERCEWISDKKDGAVEGLQRVWAELVCLDGDDGAVDDVLRGEAVFQEGVVLVDRTRQHTWKKKESRRALNGVIRIGIICFSYVFGAAKTTTVVLHKSSKLNWLRLLCRQLAISGPCDPPSTNICNFLKAHLGQRQIIDICDERRSPVRIYWEGGGEIYQMLGLLCPRANIKQHLQIL